MRFDSGQSDTFSYKVKYSVDLKNMQYVSEGLINIMTLATTSTDYMWGVSTQGVAYINVSGTNFKETTKLDVPGIKVIAEKQHEEVLRKKYKSAAEVDSAVKNVCGIENGLERIINGVYSVVDSENTLYADFNESKIYAFVLVDKNNPSNGRRTYRTKNTEKKYHTILQGIN
ncbi:hypothetical protein [Sebaldella sp. S0638]|uniref:hypothetical protein n=1 Tax=Sebaldella sp. S0638 TaxID=2957809 RepID=UPI00209C6FE9|nr:hypothetical protein [Sebaldella sp. S0638]MCP1226202.1 hypothetical protein [Sebaldella sp. S0638]